MQTLQVFLSVLYCGDVLQYTWQTLIQVLLADSAIHCVYLKALHDQVLLMQFHGEERNKHNSVGCCLSI